MDTIPSPCPTGTRATTTSRPAEGALKPESLEACFAILPFRFLAPEDRAGLAPSLREEAFPAGTAVLQQGDTHDERVWLLLEGTVEVVDRRSGEFVIGTIGPGHYFGERSALFGQPRAFEIRARTDLRCVSLPGFAFRRLLAASPTFALALGSLLRDKQGLFRPVERFLAEVAHGASTGHLFVEALLPLYRPLAPALHRGATSRELDFDALDYVVKRLPEGVARTLSWFLTDELPPRYRAAETRFEPVLTDARRRTTYRLMPGKVVVLLRDGQTDLLDLVTCLCIFAVEARKLRRRISEPEVLGRLFQGGEAADAALPFDPAERARLERIWPGRVVDELRDLSVLHEDFTITVHKRQDDYNAAHGERWTTQVARATRALLGVEPTALPPEFEVHVISSNTHSVGNTLSPWFAARTEEILAWGAEHRPDLCALDWPHPRDLAVALSRGWLDDHPAQHARRRIEDEQDGAVLHLREPGFTGIEVQLFDLERLGRRAWDAPVPRPTRPGLLVNIDYAFGQQAEGIVTSLLALFGRNVRSINVLGKAGGLQGRRGDVLVATSFVEQTTDTLLMPPCDLDPGALQAALPGRGIHVGRVLTVAGTVLQNQTMLQYYRHIWQCVGLEMEGTWYAKRILEARRLGVLAQDASLRFAYYVSDLPLEAGHSLSGAMSAHEGIPPLYAITREVLGKVLG